MVSIKQLIEERDGLKKQLERDPRFIRLNKLESFIKLYGELQVDTNKKVSSKAGRRKSRLTMNLEESIADILTKDAPLPARIILEKLNEIGVSSTGANPLATVSTTLSRSSKFELAEGRTGWKLSNNGENTPDSFLSGVSNVEGNEY